MSDAGSSGQPVGGRPGALAPRSSVIGWIGAVLVTAGAALAAWLESLFVPYYLGSVPMPVTVVFALASNWFLPRLARALVASTIVAVLPFAAWLSVIFLLVAAGRPEGDVILPAGGAVEYIGYAVMLGGTVAGVLSIVLSAPPPARRIPLPPSSPPADEGQPMSGSSR